MADAHPIALRQRVVAAYEAGHGTYREIGALFGVGEASVNRWTRLQRKLGSVVPKRKAGGSRSTIGLRDIEAALAVRPDATAMELTAEINRGRARRNRIHVSSTKRALHRHGYVVKKSADGRWRVCGRTSPSSARSF